MIFNGVQITEESIKACRQWFADNAQACIDEVEQGFVKLPNHVNFEGYRECMNNKIRAALAGDFDSSFTLMQRAYYIQTGESVALLP